MLAASEPEKITLKFSFRLLMIASSNWTYDGSAPRNDPCRPDSEVLNWSAYLFRFL